MSPEKVQEYLRRQPFQPFRLCLSDGSCYDVRHPELAFLTRREVRVAVPQTLDEVPDRDVLCDLLHVTRIEPVPAAKPKPRRGRNNGG